MESDSDVLIRAYGVLDGNDFVPPRTDPPIRIGRVNACDMYMEQKQELIDRLDDDE